MILNGFVIFNFITFLNRRSSEMKSGKNVFFDEGGLL